MPAYAAQRRKGKPRVLFSCSTLVTSTVTHLSQKKEVASFFFSLLFSFPLFLSLFLCLFFFFSFSTCIRAQVTMSSFPHNDDVFPPNNPRVPPTPTRRIGRQGSTNHHYSIASISTTTSSLDSNFFANTSPRYPSGATNLTSLSSEISSFSAPYSPTRPSVSKEPASQQFAADQFDIIESLDYDDVDDGLIGKT